MLNTGLMLGRAVDVPNTFGFVPDAAPPLEDAAHLLRRRRPHLRDRADRLGQGA